MQTRFLLVVKYIGNDGVIRQIQAELNKVWSVSVRDGDAAKMSRVNCDWCEEKVVSEVLRKYGVRVK